MDTTMNQICHLFFAVLLGCVFSSCADEPVVLSAETFGLHADGKTDDGPVIRELLSKAAAIAGPVTIQFPKNEKIYVASGIDRYAFRLDRMRDLTLDGAGSTFLVQKDLRFLHATVCSNLTVQDLNVDTTPSPVVEAIVLRVDKAGKTLTVQLDEPEQAAELGGPTGEDGEQEFFGMLWHAGTHATASEHFSVHGVSLDPQRKGIVQVHGGLPFTLKNPLLIKPGKTRISLPVPGIAHRYGPSSMIRIDRCTNVTMQDVDVWSAPWFAFQIFRNDGDLKFQRVNIRPEPGTDRITSSWRDGFHVKGNSGRLLFDHCVLEGMNDDAFNVSSHAWRITKVIAPDCIRIKQNFPIQCIPPQSGGELLILSPEGDRRLASVGIKTVKGLAVDESIYLPGHHESPELELLLDQPVSGLQKGCELWDVTVCNPDTVIRNCTIGSSCRFQSPVTLEDCDVSAFVWFYSADVEGPMPSGSIVRDCTFRSGRGCNKHFLAFKGWRKKAPELLPSVEDFPLQNIRIEDCTFYGGLSLNGVSGAVLKKNRFKSGALEVKNSVQIEK